MAEIELAALTKQCLDHRIRDLPTLQTEIAAWNTHRNNNSNTTNVASGTGGGGNITLTANSIIAFDDSDILTFANGGKGGNITFNTPAFFGQNYKPARAGTDPSTLDGNNRVDINASGAVSGVITLPDTSFIQNSLSELPENPIDTSNLIANSCIARSSRQQQGVSRLRVLVAYLLVLEML